MNFKLQFTIEQINIILRGLDMRPHGEVRQLLDYIINEVNSQQRSEPAVEQNESTDDHTAKH
ncbi:MAG: hypothetical protein ACK5SP_02105 [bacterium]|jgi:hypothetical protein